MSKGTILLVEDNPDDELLTTSNEQRDIYPNYHLGANSYIREPVDLNQYMQTVRQMGPIGGPE